MRDAVFVSYSHADARALEELQAALAGSDAAVKITLWSDTRITPASRWRDEIEEGLMTAAAAVLFVSRAFLDSRFIREYELPSLMRAARAGELRLLTVVLDKCDHETVTDTFQAVNDPSRPLMALDAPNRQVVWRRLAAALADVAALVTDEARIGAEGTRLERDLSAVAAIAHVLDKKERARVDPAFDGQEAMRENTLVFLEGQLCQAQATWLIEESNRPNLPAERRKAGVRMLEDVARREEAAMKRATELTRLFADETLARLMAAKAGGPESKLG